MTIEAVVFDIGHVLVEWHPERPFDRLFGERRRKELFQQVDFHNMNIRSDLGAEHMEDGVAALAKKHPELAEEIQVWADCWLEMLAPDLKRSARMLKALRAKGVPVYALSNFGDRTFVLAEERYPILKEFDVRFISARLKMMKPDPAIYAEVETKTGHLASSLFFIDDRRDNIEAAQTRGWHGHLFTTEAKLADDMVARGLLTEAEAA